jgi:hypothetical protein
VAGTVVVHFESVGAVLEPAFAASFLMHRLRVEAPFEDVDTVLDVLNAGAESVVLPASTSAAFLADIPPSRVVLALPDLDVAAATARAASCFAFHLPTADIEACKALRRALPATHELAMHLPADAPSKLVADLDAAGIRSILDTAACSLGLAEAIAAPLKSDR